MPMINLHLIIYTSKAFRVWLDSVSERCVVSVDCVVTCE